MKDAESWLECLKRKFAFYGFDYFPLTKEESYSLWLEGYSVESAYDIASDVYCGFSFEEAKEASFK